MYVCTCIYMHGTTYMYLRITHVKKASQQLINICPLFNNWIATTCCISLKNSPWHFLNHVRFDLALTWVNHLIGSSNLVMSLPPLCSAAMQGRHLYEEVWETIKHGWWHKENNAISNCKILYTRHSQTLYIFNILFVLCVHIYSLNGVLKVALWMIYTCQNALLSLT